MTESEKLNNEQLLRINGKELTLLDELMNKEMKRMDQPGISENEKRAIEDRSGRSEENAGSTSGRRYLYRCAG